MPKRAKVTLNAIARAIERESPPKVYLTQGYGFLQSQQDEWAVGILGILGVDDWPVTNDGPFFRTARRVHSSPLSYAEAFNFDKIPYPAAAGAVTYAAMPEGTWIDIWEDTTHYWMNNSSSSTMHVALYELRPRRPQVHPTGLWNYLASSSSYQTVEDHNVAGDSMFHIADSTYGRGTPDELPVVHRPGLSIYENKDITSDWTIKYKGTKRMEPGENTEFEVRLGRHKYIYDVSTGTQVRYTKEQTRAYVIQIYGEPVKSTDTSVDSVNGYALGGDAVAWSPAKLQWIWTNRRKWTMPIFMQHGAPVTAVDVIATTDTMKQVIAVTPTSTTGPAGVTPTVV